MIDRSYKPLAPLTNVVTVSLALHAGLSLMAAVVAVMINSDHNAFVTAAETSPLKTLALMLVGSATAILFYILNIVLFCIWVHRAARNLRALGRTSLQFTPDAAVIWWFIPFANLVKPYQAMKEIAQASDPDVGVETAYGSDWMTGAVPVVLPIWWTVWIGQMFVSRIGEVFLNPLSEVLVYGDAAANAIAAVTCILVVKTISERQTALGTQVDLASKLSHVPDRPPGA